MPRHLRFALGLVLLFTVFAGSIAPAAARPMSRTRHTITAADTLWNQLGKWWKSILSAATDANTLAYGTDAPVASLNPNTTTITPYGADAPQTSLSPSQSAPAGDNGNGIDPFGG